MNDTTCGAGGGGIVVRLFVGPVGFTMIRDSHVGESLPLPLFSLDGEGGRFGLLQDFGAEVIFDEVRIVPEPATLLLVSSGFVACIKRRRRRH